MKPGEFHPTTDRDGSLFLCCPKCMWETEQWQGLGKPYAFSDIDSMIVVAQAHIDDPEYAERHK